MFLATILGVPFVTSCRLLSDSYSRQVAGAGAGGRDNPALEAEGKEVVFLNIPKILMPTLRNYTRRLTWRIKTTRSGDPR